MIRPPVNYLLIFVHFRCSRYVCIVCFSVEKVVYVKTAKFRKKYGKNKATVEGYHFFTVQLMSLSVNVCV